jgi:hypothetical protein
MLSNISYTSQVKHDAMSYGVQGGKYLTNFDSLRYLALNSEKNIIERTILNKQTKNYEKVSGPLRLVEYKTKYYKLVFDFDFKSEKYHEIYAGFTERHKKIIFYINNLIIQSLKETLNKPDIH